MYANGEGVPTNYIRAYSWWPMAKTNGVKQAAEGVDLLKPLLLIEEQIAEAQTLATKCYESNYKDCD